MYKKKNRQAYDQSKRVQYPWLGLHISETLHRVNQALRLAAHIEERLPVYRAVYEESQSKCFELPERLIPPPVPTQPTLKSLQRDLMAMLGFAEDPRKATRKCLPNLPKDIRSAEFGIGKLRNCTIPILEAVARVEALRCGLRLIDEQYMPSGGFPGVWGSASKQCGPGVGGSALQRLWKWFVGGRGVASCGGEELPRISQRRDLLANGLRHYCQLPSSSPDKVQVQRVSAKVELSPWRCAKLRRSVHGPVLAHSQCAAPGRRAFAKPIGHTQTWLQWAELTVNASVGIQRAARGALQDSDICN